MGPTAGLVAVEKQKICPCPSPCHEIVVAVVVIMTMMTRL